MPAWSWAKAPVIAKMPPIVIDTREQRPYQFAGAVVKTLKSGDYSLLGFEDYVAVERKSTVDAYGCLGRRRARFRRELERLGRMDYSAVVIEDSLRGFLRPPAFSRVNPRMAIGLLVEWAVRYRVPVFFAGDREHGRALTRKLLRNYWNWHREVRDERIDK